MSVTPDTTEKPFEPAGAALRVRARAEQPQPGQGIHLTDIAAQRVRDYMQKMENPDTTYLYFGAKGGGCSGLTYVLDLRDERNAPVADTDEVFESRGVIIVCDFKSYEVGNLSGTTIDFQEGLMGKGFTFHNPNAKHSCGCGSSYSA
ncbi:MAG: iron-sulfur cluster assembly accessory protein [Phycisphaerales bacterium]|nr:iron-sulfur cluster assembly accessory protein [Phycisphaerales bacterium]